MSDSSREPGWERATLEKLAFAALNEQRSARRWKIFFRLAWLALLAAIAFAALRQASPSTSTSTPHTAVVDIKGEIASGAEASAEFVVAAMRSALEDEGSQALVLLINSPGGSPVQAGIINDEIVRLKAKHKKPIYAVVEETCASAAYYSAAAADDIYVDKASTSPHTAVVEIKGEIASGAELVLGSKPDEPGCWGSVMSCVLGTAPPHPARRAGWNQATAHQGNSSGFSRTLRAAGCRQYASAPRHPSPTGQFSPVYPGRVRPRTGRCVANKPRRGSRTTDSGPCRQKNGRAGSPSPLPRGYSG